MSAPIRSIRAFAGFNVWCGLPRWSIMGVMEISKATPQRNSVGVWMIGACGGIGSTVALGVAALRNGLAATTGLASDLPPFRSAELVDPGSIVVGGHEIRSESLLDAVRASHEKANLFSEGLIRACAPQLRAMQGNIKPGTLYGANPTVRRLADRPRLDRDRCPGDAVKRMAKDIAGFRKNHRLRQVVVVYIASAEPTPRRTAAQQRFAGLRQALAKPGSRALPPSSIYALAAIEAGCPFINFTPSAGVCIPAIRERADELSVPYMGSDGKTGETLVKSALAPLFAIRNLEVLSWVGKNILGNRDGAVLKDPKTRAAKLRSKDKTLSQIVSPAVDSHVSIDYVPSLDDWKVAWDFIHFRGFLGTKMNMQFTWQGSDSVLAAPLVIDLVRFAAHEHRIGGRGPMRHLACFFKDPIDVSDQDLFSQWQRLIAHVGVE